METQAATPVSFTHGDIQLSQAVMISGVPHFTRRAIGEFLEYPEPRKGIQKVVERNQYIEAYSTVVTMGTVDGKNRDIGVYHPQGFLLICMESQTEKAKRMKEAIAAFVWEQIQPSPLSFKEVVELRKLQATVAANLIKSIGTLAEPSMIQSLQEINRMLKEPDYVHELLEKHTRQLTLPLQ